MVIISADRLRHSRAVNDSARSVSGLHGRLVGAQKRGGDGRFGHQRWVIAILKKINHQLHYQLLLY